MAKHLTYRVAANSRYRAAGWIYINPSSNSYAVGSTVTFEIRENSGSNQVTAVETDFTYPQALLQYQSMDLSAGGFQYPPPSGNGGGSGVVTIQSSGPAVTGDQLVATVTFTVLAAGAANVVFSNTCQLLDGNGVAIGLATTGGYYSLS